MIGDQRAKVDLFIITPAWLHLGRLPDGFSAEEPSPVEGFVGCMSNLKVTHYWFMTYTIRFY